MDRSDSWNFANVNDIHLGSPRSYRFRPSLHRYWDTIKQQICESSPDLLLIGGDLTRDGDTHELEYQFARDELETLPFPFFAIPGNMDVGNKHSSARGARSRDERELNVRSERLQLFASYFGPANWTFVHREVRFTGFYAAVTGSDLREEEQFWRFMERLPDLPETRHHVAMMHYWLYIDDAEEKSWDVSRNEEYLCWYFSIDHPHRRRIVDLLKKAGVDILFCGHMHTGRPVENVEGIRIYKAAATGNMAQMASRWADCEQRPGFYRCEVSRDDIVVQFVPSRVAFDFKDGAYGPGGHPPIIPRDYIVSAEKPPLAPDSWLLNTPRTSLSSPRYSEDWATVDTTAFITRRANPFSTEKVENEMSRRYLKILQKWIPLAVSYYQDWPVRENCGHFFGGVHFYGQETLGPTYAIALATSFPEFDENLTGCGKSRLIEMAVRGLRYLCFTHDTGPADCVRPKKGLGRPENAGTKWGERGRGFFPESQCGRNLCMIAQIALLLREHLDLETLNMIGRIALDYMQRFEDLQPKTGVYFDTQTEENAWTALGLVSGALFLEKHPKSTKWIQHASRWMACVSMTPEDAHNQNSLSAMSGDREKGGALDDTIQNLAKPHVVTTLPDHMCENHGMVHPSYTASAVSLGMGLPAAMFRLFEKKEPEHLYWRRQRIYNALKPLTDHPGAFLAPQGMDWPYIGSFQGSVMTHSSASLFLDDPEAAFLERKQLDFVERMQNGYDGRLLDPEIVRICHGQQDPALIKEPKGIWSIAQVYFLHRLAGPGVAPATEEDFERNHLGTSVYPHSGFALHRHRKGQTTIAWRNHFTALPFPNGGQLTLGPCKDSLLADIRISGRESNASTVTSNPSLLRDCFSIFLERNLAADSVRSDVLFASLPTGTAILVENLKALKSCTIEKITHGKMEIMNEHFREVRDECHGRRLIYTSAGQEAFEGYPSASEADDRVVPYENVDWINIDDRIGVLLPTPTKTIYHNRHHFRPWRAISDYFFSHVWTGKKSVEAGDNIHFFATAIISNQAHEDTKVSRLILAECDATAFGCSIDGFIVCANLSRNDRFVDIIFDSDTIGETPIVQGTAFLEGRSVRYRLYIAARSSMILKPQGRIAVRRGDVERLRIDCNPTGATYLVNENGENRSIDVAARSVDDRVTETTLDAGTVCRIDLSSIDA